jgi:hypothetical protein
MSASLTSAPQVHLHWVRETPARALELPVSSTLDSLDLLPESVQTAIGATGLDAVEVHLPPYRPAQFASRADWAAGLVFRQDAPGRLSAIHSSDPDPLATLALHYAFVLVHRAVSGDSTPLTLVAPAAPSALLRQPLPAIHRCSPAGGFAEAPAERGHAYRRVYRTLSLTLQAKLRQVLPPAHLESLDQLAAVDPICALLAWSHAQPAAGRHVDQLSLDIFNRNMVDRAFAGVQSRLAESLGEISQILSRYDAAPALRAAYDPARASRILARVRTRARHVNLLFANEARIISAFIQFLTRIPGWRELYASNPAAVFREVRHGWEEIEVHIRRLYQRHRHSAIGSLLLLEAARTIEEVN